MATCEGVPRITVEGALDVVDRGLVLNVFGSKRDAEVMDSSGLVSRGKASLADGSRLDAVSVDSGLGFV